MNSPNQGGLAEVGETEPKARDINLEPHPALSPDRPPLLSEDQWQEVQQASLDRRAPDLSGYGSVFAPLCAAQSQFVIGQLGQSMDGRIATVSGDSNYVSCSEALVHLHRLRALCDAVVIGVGTAVSDNPRLTVRHVSGASPARVVIDPYGRLPVNSGLLTDTSARRIIITRSDARTHFPKDVEVRRLHADEKGRLSCCDIRHALRDFRCILLEGGAWTLSRFIELGLLDRLHIMIAPLIIGSGPKGLQLPVIQALSEAMRPQVQWHPLGVDMLADLQLAP